MRCPICKVGETQLGKATITLERDYTTMVIKRVPAYICTNCGEEYIDQNITARLLQSAEAVAQAGVQVDIREYIST